MIFVFSISVFADAPSTAEQINYIVETVGQRETSEYKTVMRTYYEGAVGIKPLSLNEHGYGILTSDPACKNVVKWDALQYGVGDSLFGYTQTKLIVTPISPDLYEGNKAQVLQLYELLQKAVAETQGMSETDKVWYAYNLTHSSIVYSIEAPWRHNMGTSLMNGCGSCQAINGLCCLICKAVGLDCKNLADKHICPGGHCWSEVTIDGTTYVVDATSPTTDFVLCSREKLFNALR